jgi:hypothetical protein
MEAFVAAKNACSSVWHDTAYLIKQATSFDWVLDPTKSLIPAAERRVEQACVDIDGTQVFVKDLRVHANRCICGAAGEHTLRCDHHLAMLIYNALPESMRSNQVR